MYIEKAELKNFRNYKSLDVEFIRGVNIITGDNAQGKTNLLESLFVLSLSKSFRTSRDSEMIRFGDDAALVRAYIKRDDENTDRDAIEIIYRVKGKSVKINDVKLSSVSELLENIYIVIFSPEDMKIVKEEPEKRRRFINREMSQLSPAYFSELLKYNRILKQRNALLKEEKINGELLSVWDEELSEAGTFIIEKRAKFVEKLNEISRRLHSDITGGREELSVFYEPDIDISNQGYSEILRKTRENDIFRRTSTRGVHRDDIRIEVDGMDIRRFGSQGQQRTSALSLKLAELKLIKEETGENAVLLLDDVLSELDLKRQSYLISSLRDIQLFITTAELTEGLTSSFDGDVNVIRVSEGRIISQDRISKKPR